ncbi:DUF3825 domain-containing protein [Campylobacter jejuni]|nr:DUF3825 domain-containing protein [Campylobacter jejuni]
MEKNIEKLILEAYEDSKTKFDHVTTGHISQYLKRKYDLKINCSKALIEAGFDLEKDENEPSLVYVKKATTRNKTSNRDQIQNKVEEKPLLFQFAYFPNFLNTLQELSNIAQKEFWGNGNNILFSYLFKYFEFIYENKSYPDIITYNKDKTKACFNTGLYSTGVFPIFACFEKQENGGYIFRKFCSNGDRVLDDLEIPKSLSDYDTFKNEIIFDSKLDFRVNHLHLFERKERLPEIVKKLNDRFIGHIINGELKIIKDNYNLQKMIIPVAYKQRVVLYIPLKLQEESVDTIVVVEKEEVKNEQYYAVRTILNPHDNIYKTARVLSIVESEWVKNTI